ncbi:MAG: radical SAM protein [Rhodospirillaceae bacterium]|jgi:anaerobic magnesium-protoporphyrin IX monomethyl ester cyclase|nr:radical SAM protein [Rhodospirillaceae bacterium]MBT5375121.1 radical SAM protein [Rhodospirillaceae bacterium]
MNDSKLDLLLIHPGGRDKIYQELGEDLTAIEPPMWCGIIANYIRRKGFSVRIIDSEAEGWGPDTVSDKVAEASPVLVAMIVFGHQPSASTQMMIGAGECCSMIKEKDPDQKIIIVGGHVAALPERTVREESVDFACSGEGPITIRQLIDLLKSETPEDFSRVEGLVWRDGDEIRTNPPAALIRDLDAEMPGSAWDLLPMEKYRAHNWQCFGDLSRRMPYASVYTTLGCPYKCSFCCINAPFGSNGYRMRSPESVVDEIEHLYREYGVKTFKIVDEMFVLNERHVSGVCNLLIERGFSDDINIWAYARIDTVKDNMLEMLRRAGIRWLALGIESGSKHVRDGADKSLKTDDIVRIVREIQKVGINVIGNYIFGLPDDDIKTMSETLELAKELNCEFANFYSAMAYPGSQLYKMAEENGWELPETWGGYSQHAYESKPLPTEKVSAAEVLKFRDEAFDAYFTTPRYLDMVAQRFGWETREHVEAMSKHKLRRKIVEEMDKKGQDAAKPSAA